MIISRREIILNCYRHVDNAHRINTAVSYIINSLSNKGYVLISDEKLEELRIKLIALNYWYNKVIKKLKSWNSVQLHHKVYLDTNIDLFIRMENAAKKGRKESKFIHKKRTQKYSKISKLLINGYDSDTLLYAALKASRKEGNIKRSSEIKILINKKRALKKKNKS